MIFSSVLRFVILYTPIPPSVSNEEHSMMSSDWLRVALLLHALWHGKKRSKRHERLFTIVMFLKRKRSDLSITDKNEDVDDIVFQMICKSVVL